MFMLYGLCFVCAHTCGIYSLLGGNLVVKPLTINDDEQHSPSSPPTPFHNTPTTPARPYRPPDRKFGTVEASVSTLWTGSSTARPIICCDCPTCFILQVVK